MLKQKLKMSPVSIFRLLIDLIQDQMFCAFSLNSPEFGYLFYFLNKIYTNVSEYKLC